MNGKERLKLEVPIGNTKTTTILIVEDDKSVARFLEQAAHEAGYTAQVVDNGQKALEIAKGRSFDLLLLDVMLPGLDGLTICRRLRADGIATPILILTAKDTLQDKVDGLDSGADDYIVKPFEVEELLARMRALLRRGPSTSHTIQIEDLTLDTSVHKAIRGNKIIALSLTEYSLLEYLMRHAGRAVPRAMILDHVWQYDFDGHDNVLEVYIGYLRNKIDKGHPLPLIHTVRGVGYGIGKTLRPHKSP